MQMRRRVKLPSSSLIHYWKFYKIIAEAIGPRYKNLEGIDCVAGNIYPRDVQTPIPGQAGPYDLAEADFQPLAKALAELPHLRYPMSEKETASFMVAYGNLPNRPTWMPSLVTEEMIPMLKREQDNVMHKHIDAIQKERKAERLVAVDNTNVPVQALQPGAHLTRKDAIAYLERHGLAYDDEEAAKSPEQDTLSSEDAPQTRRANVIGTKKTNAVQRAAAIKYRAKLKDAGEPDFAERTAEKYGVSTSLLRRWVRKDEAMKKIKEKEPTLEKVGYKMVNG